MHGRVAQEVSALDRILDNPSLLSLVILLGAVVLVIVILSVVSVLQTYARERSRREIAAYIAEGSMSPEQGERLMRASDPRSRVQ